MHAFASAVASLGASPIELQQSRAVNFSRFAGLSQQPFTEQYFELFRNVDAVIDVFNYQPVVIDRKLEDVQMGYYRQYMASLFRVLMQAKRFSQIRLPSEENAEESGLPPEEFSERMTHAYDIDYNEIRSTCLTRVAELSRSKVFSLVTGQKYILNIVTEGRAWQIDAGDGDLPCGEVYIAPVEGLANGEVFFEKLFAEQLGVYEGILLRVSGGIIVGSNDEIFNEQLAKLDCADKTVCELGFGLNPNITSLCGYAVLDEKSLGTFHIAIGNNTMFGGKNESQLHLDFVGKGEIVF